METTRAVHPIAEQFSEIISGMRHDPNCRVCRGNINKGYIGFSKDEVTKKFQIQTCCGKPGETEYTRLQRRIDATGVALSNQVEKLLKAMEERLARKTLIGGLVYLWGKVRGKKENTGNESAMFKRGEPTLPA